MSTAPASSQPESIFSSMATRIASAPPALCRTRRIASWIGQVVVAVVLFQSLFFKFTYAAETQVIFGDIGGRLSATVVGVMELIAAALLLIPRTAAVGAVLAVGILAGAIFTHAALIGVVVVNPETGEGDGGTLFALAAGCFAVSAAIVWHRRAELPIIGGRIARR